LDRHQFNTARLFADLLSIASVGDDWLSQGEYEY
jgi:hypothetical protein